MSNTGLTGWDLAMKRKGADRERRRIRRAIAKAFRRLRAQANDEPLSLEFLCGVDNARIAIDAATRAKRSKRK